MSSRVEQVVTLLSSLEDGAAGDAAAARELANTDPVEAAHAIKVLVEKARSDVPYSRALASVTRALMFGTDADLPYAHRGRIYDAAAEFGLSEVAALFVTGGAEREDESGDKAPDPTIGHLSLGHKKALARNADADKMARLAYEGDARVMRELLLNPKMTESLLVRTAARRPQKAEVLMEIYRSPKWSVRMGVRRALAMNPFTPPDVALKILPHLLKGDLRMIANDNALHANVRALARKLAAGRGNGGGGA